MFILADSDGEGCKKFRVQGGPSVALGGAIVHFSLEFLEEGIQKLVRDSHGAQVDAAVELASLFLYKAPISELFHIRQRTPRDKGGDVLLIIHANQIGRASCRA